MLARASSDAGTRLRRSKSTSTVHRHAPPAIEPLDLEVAQQHALAAATAAFARSQAQESIERKANRSVELSRSKSTASRKSLTSQGSHFPPRELSIRSVPPQKSTQTTSIHRPPLISAPSTEKTFSVDPTPSSDRPLSSARLLSAQPSVTFSEYGRPTSQPKSHRQNTASSITSQQIRKARSMYYASSVQTGSPIARPPGKYLTTPAISISPALSTTPTTYIPTRSTGPSPLAVPRVPVAVTPDETIDAARDKYLQDFHLRSVKHKPSLFLAPFKKRQDKSKDKARRMSSSVMTVSSANHQDTDEPTINFTMDDSMPQPDAKDRRSFSGTLKRKIKKVFKRSSHKLSSLPVQQIEASREYFDTANDISPHTDDHAEIPRPNDALLQRVRSRTPSLEGGHPRVLRSTSRSSSNGSACSNRSLHSEANTSHASTSRVTSWDTSASGETLTQRAIKRLTVIHEAKNSISSITDRSASVLMDSKSLPLPALSAFKDPMYMESLAEEASTPSVDPKRVFSALMREIDASKSTEPSHDHTNHTPGAESDVFESSKTKALHFSGRELHSSASKDYTAIANSDQKLAARRPASVAAHSVQSKKSSIRSFGCAIKSTIRAVTPGEYRSSPYPDPPAISQEEANTPSSKASSRSQGEKESRMAIFRGLRVPRKNDSAIREPLVESYAPTTEQIETRVAKAKSRWQAPLEESATPQFPRETDRLYTVVGSGRQQSQDQVGRAHGSPGSSKLPVAQLSKPMQIPMSPSVYSRNTDGASILPNDSVLSLNTPYEHEHEHAHNGGSAVILTSHSVRSYVIGTPSPNRPSSTRSSRDWKAWLSHEVSGIEKTSQEELTIDEHYTTPSGRHKRDFAQTIRTSHTGSEDTTVIVRESFDVSTPRAHGEMATTISSPDAAHQSDRFLGPEESPSRLSNTLSTPLSRDVPHLDTSNNDTPNRTTSPSKFEQKHEHMVAAVSTPSTHRDRLVSTPTGLSSASPTPIETPKSARMNDRFPFLDTGRRSSSNNSSPSLHSKSPSSSVGSSSKLTKTTPGPKVVYSDITALPTSSTAHHVLDTPVRRREVPQKSKENITPPPMSGHKRPHILPLGLAPRPKSLQPLSSTAQNNSSVNMTQYLGHVADINHSKRNSSPATTLVVRPHLRGTIRPLSPEKLSRRPKSAFDLRNTPSPRPKSETRRPGLQFSTSSRSMAIEPNPGDEVKSGDIMSDSNSRDGSATPGQRMAERFLKERKSAAVLERGVGKSPSKFEREDTPAFL